MDRTEAKNLLGPRSDGTFLIRQKDAGEFAISIKWATGHASIWRTGTVKDQSHYEQQSHWPSISPSLTRFSLSLFFLQQVQLWSTAHQNHFLGRPVPNQRQKGLQGLDSESFNSSNKLKTEWFSCPLKSLNDFHKCTLLYFLTFIVRKWFNFMSRTL